MTKFKYSLKNLGHSRYYVRFITHGVIFRFTSLFSGNINDSFNP